MEQDERDIQPDAPAEETAAEQTPAAEPEAQPEAQPEVQSEEQTEEQPGEQTEAAPPVAEAPAPEPETADAQPEEAQSEAQTEAVPAPPAEQEGEAVAAGAEEAAAEQPAEMPRSPAELAADARYIATGKRKSSVARVILKPGNGEFLLNGRSLEVYFPRRTHQVVVKQPLETAGYVGRVDVVARIHGGGISGQADAVRHGIAKALIDADPALRGELKRRQFLTRDPREKERRKAGLKKARKRPQFSKR
jgi:small subunit ribosomal protein S9